MTEHLNVGDVTGPRWVGGTRNPDDAAWHDYVLLSPGAKVSWRDTFMAGRASRDAEVGVLREQLAAAEARAGKVWDYVTEPLTWQESLSRDFAGKPMARFVDRDEIAALMLNLSPTMALAAHDREVAARTLEAAAKDADEDADWEWLEGASFWLTERAAALRSGTEGSTDDES